MTPTYPHTIDDGAGEQLTFRRRTRDADGELLEVENRVSPGKGPPMHVHRFQDESLQVREGRIGWQVEGEAEQFAEVGESVTFRAGVAHRFWNAGETDLVCDGWVRPPDNVEFFLGEIFASTKRNGGKRPDAFDAAYLSHRYRSEFAITEIPGPVQRFVFPIQVALGKLLGRYKRFEGAPEPRRA